MIHQIQAHTEGVSSLQCDGTGSTLCTTSSDRTANLWDLRSFDITASLKVHSDTVNNSFFSNDGITLATCSDDRTVCVWDSRQLSEPVLRVSGFHDGINKILVAPIEGIICILSAADDGQVYINRFADGAAMESFWAATSTINDLVLDPVDPTILLTCSEDCSVRSWRLGSQPPRIENKDEHEGSEGPPRLIASLDEFENPVNHIALHAGWVFAACAECIFSTEYVNGTGLFGTSARGFACHTDYVRGIEFLGEDTMYTISDDTTVVEWCLGRCEPRRQIKVHDEFSMALASTKAIAPNSERTLITGCEDGKVRFWSLPFSTESFA
jgi:WD40 repeat protein